MLSFLIISIICSLGLSIILTQKGSEWPVKYFRIILQKYLKKIHWKLPQALFCVICTSFWTTLITDIVLFIMNLLFYNQFYFLWPLSGFAVSGLAYLIFEIINALETQPIINVD